MAEPNTVEPYVRETFTSWLKPPVGSREDIVGIRALPDGRTEYLVKGGFPAYYLAVSAPQPDPIPAKPPEAAPEVHEQRAQTKCRERQLLAARHKSAADKQRIAELETRLAVEIEQGDKWQDRAERAESELDAMRAKYNMLKHEE